ncbi:MAG: hypothetical protein H6587_09795 [Flavobacteriales bacterium]|nr:hypothetical protein [Flavobacteriales bacterium]
MNELIEWLVAELEQAEKEKGSAQQNNNNKHLFEVKGKITALNHVKKKIEEIINH